MKLNYKNTIVEYKFKKTDNILGLSKDDFWINVEFYIKNNEKEIKLNREAISYNELLKLLEIANNVIENDIDNNIKFTLIKNYDQFEFRKGKLLIQKLYLFDKLKEYYEIIFNESELKEFYNNVKNFVNNI